MRLVDSEQERASYAREKIVEREYVHRAYWFATKEGKLVSEKIVKTEHVNRADWFASKESKLRSEKKQWESMLFGTRTLTKWRLLRKRHPYHIRNDPSYEYYAAILYHFGIIPILTDEPFAHAFVWFDMSLTGVNERWYGLHMFCLSEGFQWFMLSNTTSENYPSMSMTNFCAAKIFSKVLCMHTIWTIYNSHLSLVGILDLIQLHPT